MHNVLLAAPTEPGAPGRAYVFHGRSALPAGTAREHRGRHAGRASSRPATPPWRPTGRSPPTSCPRRPPPTARSSGGEASPAVQLLVLDRKVAATAAGRGRGVTVSARVAPGLARARPSSCSCACPSTSAGGRWPARSSTTTRWRASRCAWRHRYPARVVLTLRDGATALAVSRTLHVGPQLAPRLSSSSAGARGAGPRPRPARPRGHAGRRRRALALAGGGARRRGRGRAARRGRRAERLRRARRHRRPRPDGRLPRRAARARRGLPARRALRRDGRAHGRRRARQPAAPARPGLRRRGDGHRRAEPRRDRRAADADRLRHRGAAAHEPAAARLRVLAPGQLGVAAAAGLEPHQPARLPRQRAVVHALRRADGAADGAPPSPWSGSC